MMKNNQSNYTCNCCGYKTLPNNSEGESCPICHWEAEYFYSDDLLGFSHANYMTLFEAQENYLKYGCSKERLLKYCRKPLAIEDKDQQFLTVQEIIENKYNNTSKIKDEIDLLSKYLHQADAQVSFDNFKTLKEIDIMHNYDDLRLNLIEFGERFSLEKRGKELLLKSLAIKLAKEKLELLITLFEQYYTKGISYYIVWTILLTIILKANQLKLNAPLTELLLNIEINNYYGINSLENSLKDYWHSYIEK